MSSPPAGALPGEITALAATELADAIRAGSVSAAEATEASLAAIAAEDPALHAFVTVDAEGARTAARALDERRASGDLAGPLHGVPVAIKDLVDVEGLPTTRGSLRHANDIAPADDLVVARLRAAGAVIVGKTNTPEFGFGALCRNPVGGNTGNPAAPGRSSGGSSGGSAAAVAAGMVPLAHGTDFGGSVRTPASFCGIVGFRPGPGLIPSATKPLAWNALAVHGVLARTVADAALMASVMSGGDPRDPISLDARAGSFAPQDVPAARLAASADLGGITPIDPAVRSVFERALGRIPDTFGVVRAAPDLGGAPEAFATLRAAIILHELGPLLTAAGPPLSPTVRWNIEQGVGISAADYLAAEAARSRLYRASLAFFETHDFLLTVAASVPPFPLDQEDVEAIDGTPMANPIAYLAVTSAISLIGLPAISVPCGRTGEGLPVGLQIVGPPRSEARLLGLAARLHAILPPE
ncbi:amidase [Acuticoccus sediminis]|uniref:amidase n=1 Tax=Acuticoccus sediminis TaxID=2184697 RepID=UPI001CFE3238|nr:amidase [Acuticoccus sediminis]